MKPLKTFAIVPILAMVGLTAATVTAPAAFGDDTVKVRASVLLTVNGVAMGYLSYGEPLFDQIFVRVVEPPVVYVYREPPRPIRIHEHARPIVIVKKERRDYDRPARGYENGYYKQDRTVIVIGRDNHGFDRADHGYERPDHGYERADRGKDRHVRGGERYVQFDERQIQNNGQTTRFENRNNRDNGRNARGDARQVVESRKGKHNDN